MRAFNQQARWLFLLLLMIGVGGCGVAADLAGRLTRVEVMPLGAVESPPAPRATDQAPAVGQASIGTPTPNPTLPPTPTPTSALFPIESAEWLLPDTILWQSDVETGDISEWQQNQSDEAIFNTGTGRVDVSDEIARSGRYSLKLSIDNASGQTQAARIFRWSENAEAAYYSAWFYFPEKVTPAVWWNIFQFKSNNGQSLPTWIVNVGRNEGGEMYLYLWDDITDTAHFQPLPGQLMPLPIGEWVHIEAFVRQAQGQEGHISLWQNGVRLYDVQNVQTTLADNIQWSINNYTDNIDPGRVVIYADDAMIAYRRRGIDQ